LLVERKGRDGEIAVSLLAGQTSAVRVAGSWITAAS